MGCAASSCKGNGNDRKFQNLSYWQGKELSLEQLKNRLTRFSGEKCRYYTVASTKLDNGEQIRHSGSGPNLEGEIATLCTCMHSMRSKQSIEEWQGQWVVGLTSSAIKNGFASQHYLLYMMRVEKAFESHKDIYEYLKRSHPNALKAKEAVENPYGDIYTPKAMAIQDRFNPSMYEHPHRYHSHGSEKGHYGEWHEDIKIAPLLLGEPENTFVWSRPVIKVDTHIHRTVFGTRQQISPAWFATGGAIDFARHP